MASTRTQDDKLIQVRVEYKAVPPQCFISQMNQFIQDHQPPGGFKAEISWERVLSSENIELEEQQQRRVRDLPPGYDTITDAPALRGPNHCQRCLCAPCIISSPPEFLRGSCSPHPANTGKRHSLYKKFRQCLDALGVWQDSEYLSRKEGSDDRRDIIPDCVIEEVRRRYPSQDGLYGDYTRTYDASRELTR